MLSVLIPVYNYDISALLNAVQKQCTEAGIAYEIVIGDDASANPVNYNTAQCRTITNNVNKGRTATRLILAKEATYDTLLFLDADVMPADGNFINRYLPYAKKNQSVVFGGYTYSKMHPGAQKSLRYAYGLAREQRTAARRQADPFNVFSGNLLIQKKVFFECNPVEATGYGLDILFSYNLYQKGIEPVHIDNPIIHLGLEDNEVFLAKALESVAQRKQWLNSEPGLADINSLCRYYLLLKNSGTAPLVARLFTTFDKALSKRFLKEKPSLRTFDLYRLGYMCSLKN